MSHPIRPGLGQLCRLMSTLSSGIGTPFYAYDWPSLQQAASSLLRAASLPHLAGRAKFYLAFFSLPNVTLLLKLLKSDSRLGLSCNSPEEICALQHAGFREWDRVVFSGGVLPKRELLDVAANGCLVHAASPGNLALLAQGEASIRIGLRLDFTSSALKGIRIDQLPECLQLIYGSGKTIAGLHAYPGTQVADLEVLTQHADLLLSAAVGIDGLEELNFGGGFRYDYEARSAENSVEVDLGEYFRTVSDLVEGRNVPSEVTLAWEPGRVVFAGAGFFVSEVIEVRRSGPSELDVYVDSSFAQVPAPRIVGRRHRTVLVDPEGRVKQGSVYETRICGATTLSSDQLLPFPYPLPRAEPGDKVVLLDVGAYGRAGAYNFLGRALPPEILLIDEGWKILRNRQRPDHLLGDLADTSVC